METIDSLRMPPSPAMCQVAANFITWLADKIFQWRMLAIRKGKLSNWMYLHFLLSTFFPLTTWVSFSPKTTKLWLNSHRGLVWGWRRYIRYIEMVPMTSGIISSCEYEWYIHNSYGCRYICICVCPHVHVWGQAFAYINKLLVCTCTFLFDSLCVSLYLPLNKNPTLKSCWGYKMYLLKHQ